MMDLMQCVWSLFILSTLIFFLCFCFDLIHHSAIRRRAVWRVGISTCLIFFVFATINDAEPDANTFWRGEATASATNSGDLTLLFQSSVGGVAPIIFLPSTEMLAGTAAWRSAAGVYSFGLLFVVALLILRFFVAIRHVQGLPDASNRRLSIIGQKQARLVGCYSSVTIKWQDSTISPAQAGLFRCTLIVPRSAQYWSTRRLNLVFLHEMSHFKNRDNFWHFCCLVLCAIQWFNPFAWLVLRRLRLLSEMSADETVLNRQNDPTQYADMLVALARNFRKHRLGLAMAATSILPARIHHILKTDSQTSHNSRIAVALACALFGVTGTSVAVLDETPEKHIIGSDPQQIRWESDLGMNAVFLHGDIHTRPGSLDIGVEGMVVAFRDSEDGFETCIAWKTRSAELRKECDGTVEFQRWIDEGFQDAARGWQFDEESPLVQYWTSYDDDEFAGSHVIGIPGSSRNPTMRTSQIGWIDGDGARVGIYRIANRIDFAFRYEPKVRQLSVMRRVHDRNLQVLESTEWRAALATEQVWFLAANKRAGQTHTDDL